MFKRISSFLRRLFSKNSEEPDEMKYLIVGLGNMGAEYDGTRHNIGFDIVDKLAEEYEVKFEHERLGDVGTFRFRGRQFVLLKPSTYMNRSGKAVRYWMQKHKVKGENVLILVDDLNLPFGKLRMRGKGSHGGHNGLRDIIEQLGHNQFARMRLGIGDTFSKGRQVDYVLGKWSSEELEKLPEVIKRGTEAVKSFGSIGLARSMNTFNN